MSSNDNAIQMITAMGFDAAQAQQALQASNGNVEHAVNFLLMGGGSGGGSGGGGSASASSTSVTGGAASERVVVVGPISQYSVDNGRSACTCIALTAATQFLQSPSPSQDNLTADFLQSMIVKGVEHYHHFSSTLSSSSGSGSVEHLSPEEVLQHAGQQFPLQMLPGGIRQGALSPDPHHPLGLSSLLQAIHQEQPPSKWMALLMTKTPETVCLLFPPPASSPSSSSTGGSCCFWLVDSHPRSGIEGSYAKSHSSLHELAGSLQTIFPFTDLGPDVPEMMAAMYNSFDLYPLLLLLPATATDTATTMKNEQGSSSSTISERFGGTSEI